MHQYNIFHFITRMYSLEVFHDAYPASLLHLFCIFSCIFPPKYDHVCTCTLNIRVCVTKALI